MNELLMADCALSAHGNTAVLAVSEKAGVEVKVISTHPQTGNSDFMKYLIGYCASLFWKYTTY